MKELKERMNMEIALLNLKLSKDAKDIAEATKLEALAESTRAKERGDNFDKSLSKLEQMAEKEAKCTNPILPMRYSEPLLLTWSKIRFSTVLASG